MATTCSRCGKERGFIETFVMEHGTNNFFCQKCDALIEGERNAKVKDRLENLKRLAAGVIVTTTPGIDGHRIVKYLGIESVEFVIGTGVFSEVSSSIADFFGARSSAFETKLRTAKIHAMDALKFVAAEKGANAVVAVDLDYTEFSGNRIALIINGTLVKATSIDPRP